MKNKKLISLIIGMILGFGLLYLVIRGVGFRKFGLYISDLNYWWIVFAVFLYTLDMLVRAYRWREILKDNEIYISVRESFFAYNLGNSLNILIPAKIGDIARSYYLKEGHGYGYESTIPSIVLDRFFDVVGVYIVILISSIYVLKRVKMPQWFFYLCTAGVIALIAAFAIIYIIVRKKDRVQAIKNERVRSFILSSVNVVSGSVKNREKFIELTIYSAAIWVLEGLVTFVVFLAMGHYMNPIEAIFANMVATLTKVFPVTPGGIGVFEGTMAIVLSIFGQEASAAGALSTLNHLLMNLYTIGAGMYVLIKSGISISKIRDEKVERT